MNIKDSGKLVINYSKHNFTDTAVAVLEGVGTTGRVIYSPKKRCGVQRNL